MRLRVSLFAAALLTAAVTAGPASAGPGDGPEGIDPKLWKDCTALVDAWFAAPDDAAKTAVETKAAALPPIPETAALPLAAKVFELAAKTGPKLKKSGKAYFYDEKTKRGLYMVGAASKKPTGLLLALHGGGVGAGDAGSAFSIFAGATGEGMTVIAPEVMAKVSSAWNEEAEERMVLDLIEAAKRTFPVDTNRIYIAGHSMGGDGSWMIGGRNADLFAAAAPMAGSVMPYMVDGKLNRRETPRSDYKGLMEGVVPNLMHVPYHISHSADDRNEAIHPDDIATGYLTKLAALCAARKPPTPRYEFVYDRIDGNGHALPPTGVAPVIKWMAKRTRAAYPDEVVWETWWPWKRQSYWLYHPSPRDSWRFTARVTAPNTVDVTATTKLFGDRETPKELDLTILLSPKMFDLTKPFKVTHGKDVLHDAPAARSLWAILVSAARRNDPERWFEAAVTVKVPRRMWRDAWDEEPPK
jgi:predicted esterase